MSITKEDLERIYDKIDALDDKIVKKFDDVNEKINTNNIAQVREMSTVKVKLATVTAIVSTIFGLFGSSVKQFFDK